MTPAINMQTRRLNSCRPATSRRIAFESLESRSLFAVIPALNSLPTARDYLYLDFDGHVESSTVFSPAYERDNDSSSFTDAEVSDIRKIWEYVSEDYAPFNINVTTVLPPNFDNGVALRVVIGGKGEWAVPPGVPPFLGGVADVNSFTSDAENTAWVFTENLGGPIEIAQAASHEAGHGFGLDHQSGYLPDGTRDTEYRPGNADKGPLMGRSYESRRSVWSNGTSTSATTFQDDMAVIARAENTFGYRPDEYGNTLAAAQPLKTAPTGIRARGVIARTNDVDYFLFSSGAGDISLRVVLPEQNNLDAVLELRSADGKLVARSSPVDDYGAALTYRAVGSGQYYAAVRGRGFYGDVGQYVLTGTVPRSSVDPSLAAPAGLQTYVPNPSTVRLSWNAVAAATAYRIERKVGTGAWGVLRTVSKSSTYILDSRLKAGVIYSYRVVTLDADGESLPSSIIRVKTG